LNRPSAAQPRITFSATVRPSHSHWPGHRKVSTKQGAPCLHDVEQPNQPLFADLTRQFGRSFGRANLWPMRAFYRAWAEGKILQTLPGEIHKP
jgi:hypothetical protein